MKITKSRLAELVREVVQEEKAEYEKFFRAMLKKYGVKSPAELSDEEKKKFFNQVDSEYKAKNEALKGDQHKLDVDGDGDIEADDLADLRAGKKANESSDCGCGCGGVTEGGCGDTKVTEGVSPKDMESIKGAVQSASSFMNIGSELKKLGMKYIFATSPMPIYVVQDKGGNRVGIVNKKYATKPDFVHGDTAVGVMESLTEGRAFINAARKAKSEGKTEFEFNGKTYPVTIKESVVNEDANMNKKVKAFLDKGLRDLTKGKPNHHFAVMNVLMGALTDANFHSEAKKVPSIFPKAKYEGDPMGKKDVIGIYEEMGENVASICKWDGKDIVDAIGFYVSMTIGRPVGEKVEKLVESVNEGASTEEKKIVMMTIKKIAKYRNVPLDVAVVDVIRAASELERTIKK